MLTNRDIEIFKFLNRYGKTYIEVLGKTFFSSEQIARNRVNRLAKYNLIGYWNTGLMKPRRALVLTSDSKAYLDEELGYEVKKAKINQTTIHHNVLEQITDFYLQKIGKVERATVYTHYKHLNHIPDFIYYNEDGKKFYIECEVTKKSINRYNLIVDKATKDNPYAVIYVADTIEKAKAIARVMPVWSKLFYIDLEGLIKNISNVKKIQPIAQRDLLEN